MAAYAARRSSGPVIRSISPSRFTRHYTSSNTPSFRSPSSGSSISFSTRPSEKSSSVAAAPRKRVCLCAPTSHPGSFRCSMHKSGSGGTGSRTASFGGSGRLTMWRSAMKNSLVRIGTVEGDLVKRALSSLIRPSSHQQRRRGEFRRCPSRLSVMSKAG